MSEHKLYGIRARRLYRILIVICTLALIIAAIAFYVFTENTDAGKKDNPSAGLPENDADAIVNGIHLRTGLIVADGYREVINNCTNCHSASLVTQNRMDAKGWEATIRWMQETQNLWDLGEKEAVIIKYLVANYPVENKGRREPLQEIQWYRLDGE